MVLVRPLWVPYRIAWVSWEGLLVVRGRAFGASMFDGADGVAGMDGVDLVDGVDGVHWVDGLEG